MTFDSSESSILGQAANYNGVKWILTVFLPQTWPDICILIREQFRQKLKKKLLTHLDLVIPLPNTNSKKEEQQKSYSDTNADAVALLVFAFRTIERLYTEIP